MDHKLALAAYCDATEILHDAFDRIEHEAPWWRRLPWPGNRWLQSMEIVLHAADYTIIAASQHMTALFKSAEDKGDLS
jgi:hypothetical protein